MLYPERITAEIMGNTWITDLTHFLDDRGQPTDHLGTKKIANHFGSIVSGLTANPSAKPCELSVPCRRRPKRKACPGKIHATFEPGTSSILWFCPVCEDRGYIHNWQNTFWDKGGRVGLPRIDRITYTRGFTNDIEDESGLVKIVLEGDAITQDLINAIHDNQLIDSTGEYGDPTAGDPIQVDQLDIEHGGGLTSIRIYNRAIMLFATNEKFFRQVHQVCYAIDKQEDRE